MVVLMTTPAIATIVMAVAIPNKARLEVAATLGPKPLRGLYLHAHVPEKRLLHGQRRIRLQWVLGTSRCHLRPSLLHLNRDGIKIRSVSSFLRLLVVFVLSLSLSLQISRSLCSGTAQSPCSSSHVDTARVTPLKRLVMDRP